MKTVIVTGASGNLGQAICQKFLSEGANVIGTATSDVVLPFSHDKKFERYVIDLRREELAEHFVDLVQKKYGSIDTAVLTVGGFAAGKMQDTRIAAIEQQLQLNFATAYNIARPVFSVMMKQGYGRIFLTSSRTGSDMRFSKGALAYGLSKSLLIRLTEWMNEEAKGTNVVSSVILPSTIDTPENRKSMPGADFNSWVKTASIADMVFAFASEDFADMREPVIKAYGNA